MEEPYILKYSESEAETFTQGTTRIPLWPINILTSEPSPISRYGVSAKMTKFSLLRFSGMKAYIPLASIVAVFQLHSETSLIQKPLPPKDSP